MSLRRASPPTGHFRAFDDAVDHGNQFDTLVVSMKDLSITPYIAPIKKNLDNGSTVAGVPGRGHAWHPTVSYLPDFCPLFPSPTVGCTVSRAGGRVDF